MSSQLPDNSRFDEDPRYRIAVREALIALVYWLLYTFSVTFVAMSIGYNKPARDIHFILGFPAWYFWTAGIVTLVFCILPYFIIKYLFTEISLSPEDSD